MIEPGLNTAMYDKREDLSELERAASVFHRHAGRREPRQNHYQTSSERIVGTKSMNRKDFGLGQRRRGGGARY
jgi:hypothetical protein